MKLLVQCGRCAARLNLLLENPDIANPVFTCPSCGMVNKVHIKKEAPAPVPTPVAGWLQFTDKDKAVKKYDLLPGLNRVGRKSEKSNADIQIDTDDTYFSRNHFSIQVEGNKKGGYDYLLRDNHSVNGVFLNDAGTPLSANDEIFLQADDHIRAGQTALVLKLPAVPGVADASKTTISTDHSKTYIV